MEAAVPGATPVDLGGLYPRPGDDSKNAMPLDVDIVKDRPLQYAPHWEAGVYIGTAKVGFARQRYLSVRF